MKKITLEFYESANLNSKEKFESFGLEHQENLFKHMEFVLQYEIYHLENQETELGDHCEKGVNGSKEYLDIPLETFEEFFGGGDCGQGIFLDMLYDKKFNIDLSTNYLKEYKRIGEKYG